MTVPATGGGAGQPQTVGAEPRRRGVTTIVTTMGSAVALLASGVSLWETVLKQPSLKLYVGESIFYTRDPWGSYEVFVVPVTIVNSGAQDGAIVSLRLELTNAETGIKETFASTYTADASWFSGSDNVTNRTKRPKSPFSAIPVAGRSAWTGTVLFYTPEYRDKRIVEPRSQVAGQLTVSAPRSEGWLDRLFSSSPDPIQIAMAVPNFLPGALLTGDVARVRVSWPGPGGVRSTGTGARPGSSVGLPDWGAQLQQKDAARPDVKDGKAP